MSLTLPTPSNDYLIEDDFPLDPDHLNPLFASISARLKAQESLVIAYEAAIDALNNLGLQVIAETLGPTLEQARDDLDALQAQTTALAAEIESILAGVVPATMVIVTAMSGLTAANAQAAIAELLGKITANATTAADATATLATAVAAIEFGTIRPFVATSASMTAVAGHRIRANTSGGVVTITLPPAPANGDTVDVLRFGANAVIVDRNGKTIKGQADNLTIDFTKFEAQLRYFDGDWDVYGRVIA